MSTFGHSIFTAWPVYNLLFTVRKCNFFRKILELPTPIFQKNLNFQKCGHRAVLFLGKKYSFFFLCGHSGPSSSENAHTVSPLQPCCLLQELIYENMHNLHAFMLVVSQRTLRKFSYYCNFVIGI